MNMMVRIVQWSIIINKVTKCVNIVQILCTLFIIVIIDNDIILECNVYSLRIVYIVFKGI